MPLEDQNHVYEGEKPADPPIDVDEDNLHKWAEQMTHHYCGPLVERMVEGFQVDKLEDIDHVDVFCLAFHSGVVHGLLTARRQTKLPHRGEVS